MSVKYLVALLFCVHAAQGQAQTSWKPERPVEIIVPSSPGGSFDKTARMIERIARENKLLDVPVVVVNRPGGGGNLALAYMQQRPREEPSLMVASTALLANHILGRSNITYRDLTPVAMLFAEYVSTIAGADSGVADADELLRRLWQSPSAVSFGFCCALGGGNHLAAAMLVKALGGDVKRMKTIVFKGAGNATTAVLGGHVDVLSNPASNVIAPIKDGQLKVLGVAAPKRVGGLLADVPTWRERNLDVTMALWRNIVGPTGMPPAEVKFWEAFFLKLTQTRAWQTELSQNMWTDLYMTGPESKGYLDKQYSMLKELLSEVGLAKK